MSRNTLNTIGNQAVKAVFASYPDEIRSHMETLRQLILDTAEEIGLSNTLEETLKWGEPSYLCKKGSTVRIDWKESAPDAIGMYFNCRTKLIDTFRAVFKDELKFEGNRAIIIDISRELPIEELKTCVSIALTYHTRKHLPLLGA